jgi:indole-3-glycerol phosphate synthase
VSTILQEIIDKKTSEITVLKEEGFRTYNQSMNHAVGLHASLLDSERIQVIAEIKRASPSKGDIGLEVDPIEQAKKYETAGAAAISVLTDTPFFKGTMDDLAKIRKVVSIPILCKDFILDPVQIDRAKDAGANIILLIVAALDEHTLYTLFDYAESQRLEVLVEVHSEAEMNVALDMGARIIGINNRNLKTFEVSLEVTERLAALVKSKEIVLISESGIKHDADCKRAAKAGAHGVLVGETLMKSKDSVKTLASLKVLRGE